MRNMRKKAALLSYVEQANNALRRPQTGAGSLFAHLDGKSYSVRENYAVGPGRIETRILYSGKCSQCLAYCRGIIQASVILEGRTNE